MADKFITTVANDGSVMLVRYKDNLDGTHSPDTGSGLAGGGGGSGGNAVSGAPVIDSSVPPKRFMMVQDSTADTVTFYNFGTNTTGTPTLPVYPEADSSSADVKKIAAVTVNGVTLIKDNSKTRRHIAADGSVMATYYYTTDGQFAGEA